MVGFAVSAVLPRWRRFALDRPDARRCGDLQRLSGFRVIVEPAATGT
jgi:hypothetical protein